MTSRALAPTGEGPSQGVPAFPGLVRARRCPLDAMVAREFGMPAVVAVAGATSHIRTGDWLELDGSRGTVAPIEAPTTG